MATNTIVAIVLGLIILVILAIFIQQQVTKGGKKFENISEQAGTEQDKCSSLIFGRFCTDKACDTSKGYVEEAGMWKDCQSPKHCCKKA